MCFLQDSAQSLGLLAELIGILQKGSQSMVYQCLYAVANLVEVNGNIVVQLFQLGLATTLAGLNSNDMQLLKPILALMTAIHGLIPEQFLYLEQGFCQSLSLVHLESSARDQILIYLNRS